MGAKTPKRLEVDQRVRRSSLSAGVGSLMESVEQHDSYTVGHSSRVCELATMIAAEIGLPPEDVQTVTQAALVHDIGKIGIPEEILRKSEPLTDREFEMIKLHPVLGAGILSRVPGTEKLVPIVMAHHERWDGTGYPNGLIGAAIPLEARIIFVCDAFDAMTSQRPYGRVLNMTEAIEELQSCEGMQFDPLVVNAISKLYNAGALDDWTTTSV